MEIEFLWRDKCDLQDIICKLHTVNDNKCLIHLYFKYILFFIF